MSWSARTSGGTVVLGKALDLAETTYAIVGVTDDGRYSLRPVAHGEVIELTPLQLRSLGVIAPDPRTLRPADVEDVEVSL